MINLYGQLGRTFKHKYNHTQKNIDINVNSVHELIKAMNVNFKNFSKLFNKNTKYKIVNGDDILSNEGLSKEDITLIHNKPENNWHIMPISAGSSGEVKFVFGVILMAAGAYISGMSFGWAAPIGGFLFNVGAGMVLYGVAEIIALPSNNHDTEKQDEKASYLYNGPRNKVEPGCMIPIIFGEMYVGSILASATLKTVNEI